MRLPEIGVTAVVIQFVDFGADPSGDVHAVGDAADGTATFTGEQWVPHLTGDLSVQCADAVGAITRAQCQRCHVERTIAGVGQLHQGVGRKLMVVGPGRDVTARQVVVEDLVTGGDRRVRGEDAVASRLGDRRVQFTAVIGDALEGEQRGVALVHVPDAGVDAELLQHHRAADAEHPLLAEAHLAAADVKHRGDGAIGRVVLEQIAVQQQHGNAPDLRFPDTDARGAISDRQIDLDVVAVFINDGEQRDALRVVVGVEVLLLTVGVHRLAEVAVAVHQPDADKRQSEVTRRLGVVAGEDAEAAGVDVQALVPAELGREVGDRLLRLGVRLLEPGRLLRRHVLVEAAHEVAVAADEALRAGQLGPALRLEVDQQLDRVAVALPTAGIDLAEQLARLRRPGPPEVEGDVAQAAELKGQFDPRNRARLNFREWHRVLLRRRGRHRWTKEITLGAATDATEEMRLESIEVGPPGCLF